MGFTHLAFIRALFAYDWPKRERVGCVAVAAALASHAGIGTGDNCWPSTDTLARESGVSRPTVIRARRALRDAGFLVWETARGRAHGFRYQLLVPVRSGPGSKTDAPRDNGHGKPENPTRADERTPSRSNGGTVTRTEELGQGTGGRRARTIEGRPPPLRKLLEDEDLPEDTWIGLLRDYARARGIPGARSKNFVTQARETLRCGVSRLGMVKALEAERGSGAPRVYYRLFDQLKGEVQNRMHLDPHVVTPERLKRQLGRPLSSMALSPDEIDELAASIRSRGLTMHDVSSAVSHAVTHAPSAQRTHQLALLVETLSYSRAMSARSQVA